VEYKRKNSSFSLCGLNCCLCPRFNTQGVSQCPGCGGKDFFLKHPSCTIITCSKKNGNIEYCFNCAQFPCKKYLNPGNKDSFITYKNVNQNLNNAKNDFENYLSDLNKKYEYLIDLIDNYNDGRSKNFYCLAINLLPLNEIRDLMIFIEKNIKNKNIDIKEKAKMAVSLFRSKALELNIELILRK
jgi:hypothetical protein